MLVVISLIIATARAGRVSKILNNKESINNEKSNV